MQDTIPEASIKGLKRKRQKRNKEQNTVHNPIKEQKGRQGQLNTNAVFNSII